MHDVDADVLALLGAIARAKGEELATVRGYLERSGTRIENGTFIALAFNASTMPSTLDLRPFRALETVSANGAGWKVQATSVELGSHPRLRKLLLGSQKLTRIELSGCTSLVDLDLSYNQLTEVVLPKAAPLEILHLTENPLRGLDVSHHVTLERLEVMRAGLSRLDVAPLVRLRSLLLAGNALSVIDLPEGAAMKNLFVSANPIGRLDVTRYPMLETLMCDRVGLSSLDLSRNGSLGHLSCGDNALEALDLRHNLLLRRLSVQRCGAKEIDVRGLDQLTHLDVDDEVKLLCSERQKRALPALRKRFGLAAHRKIEDMDLWELDLLARGHNWDDGVKKLLAIARHPRCDLGTALAIYWLGAPDELAEYREPAQAPRSERAVVELLRTIEERVARDGYATREVSFGGADATDERIPPAMHQRIGD